MRRAGGWFIGLGFALALLLFCYRAALFGGEQFAHRDAAHFFYPLYLRVQQEWEAGRWPLWDPWQNGGQPLLGSPVAAVLYPGKLVHAILPYSWAARLYVVGHTALAFLGMVVLARSLGVGATGSALAGLSFAFGAPVLFLYSNTIYLVGAAWLPWGLRAVDRLVRQGRRIALAELAAVLALAVLGGDPQTAYLMVACGVALVVVRALRARPWPSRLGFGPAALGAAALLLWIAAMLTRAATGAPVPGWIGPIWVPAVVGWLAAGWFLARRRGEAGNRPAAPAAGLAASAALAMALAAAQIVPTAEFALAGNRTVGAGTLTWSKFSTEPYRLVECLWPGVFGRRLPENRTWIQAIPPVGDRQVWCPSLYVGGLTLVLVLGAAGFRGGDDGRRAWLVTIGLVSLAAGFGRFGGPLFWVRAIPGAASFFGPHDPLYSVPRADAYLEDGTGGPYSVLAALLPGFGLFRYPSKLFTVTAAAASALAGLGWDEAMSGRSRRFVRWSALGVMISLAALVPAATLGSRAVAALEGVLPGDPYSGPADVAGAWAETLRALGHGAVVCCLALALMRWGPRRPALAGLVAPCVMAVDLGAAGAGFVWTAPQSVFDRVPELARVLEAAERERPWPGPYRIHRMPLWHPGRFLERRSPDRIRELLEWERDTLQGLHAMPLGFETTMASGVLELEDYLAMFSPRTLPAGDLAARALGVRPGSPIVYQPRRMYDLWGTRYFVLPVRSDGWGSESRGYAAFVAGTELVAPGAGALVDEASRGRWVERDDWQLVRNRDAYPRAWIVHRARVVAPANVPAERARLTATLVYQGDPLWSDPQRPVFDPRSTCWIETDRPERLRGFGSPAPVSSGESATVVRHEPERVELRATLERPGFVILADTFYPGWRLTIDGRPATIYRANRMMRGAAVTAGTHTLVYSYDPWSFRIGMTASLAALVVLLVLVVRELALSRRRAG